MLGLKLIHVSKRGHWYSAYLTPLPELAHSCQSGSGYGLSPVRRQAITGTNVDLSPISTTRFARDVEYRMANNLIGLYKAILFMSNDIEFLNIE